MSRKVKVGRGEGRNHGNEETYISGLHGSQPPPHPEKSMGVGRCGWCGVGGGGLTWLACSRLVMTVLTSSALQTQ